jgi:DNA repair protein RadC
VSIKDWPSQERPRERLLKQGAKSLSDAELLAIFLRTGTRNISAVDLARQLLQQFGSLSQLLKASQADFCAAMGLGEAKFTPLQAVMEMSRRVHADGLQQGQTITRAADAANFLMAELGDRPAEVFGALFLDTKHHILTFEELFHGTIDHTSVHPRELIRRVMHHNAARIILAHKHPSGDTTPSQTDIELTKSLKNALDMLDVKLLDHLVIGKNAFCSLAERGFI